MKISDPLGKVYTHTMFKNGAKQLHKRYEGVAAAGLDEEDSGDSGGDAEGDVVHTVADHHRIMGRNQFSIPKYILFCALLLLAVYHWYFIKILWGVYSNSVEGQT